MMMTLFNIFYFSLSFKLVANRTMHVCCLNGDEWNAILPSKLIIVMYQSELQSCDLRMNAPFSTADKSQTLMEDGGLLFSNDTAISIKATLDSKKMQLSPSIWWNLKYAKDLRPVCEWMLACLLTG